VPREKIKLTQVQLQLDDLRMQTHGQQQQADTSGVFQSRCFANAFDAVEGWMLHQYT
jgi:hypothetical protein